MEAYVARYNVDFKKMLAEHLESARQPSSAMPRRFGTGDQ
jgi:hypothetical protein